MNPIKNAVRKTDAIDRLKHKPEPRLFATILFDLHPASKVHLLYDVKDSSLSIWGRRLKSEIYSLHREQRVNPLSMQCLFVGKGYKGPRLAWFLTVINAAPSLISHPFDINEIKGAQ